MVRRSPPVRPGSPWYRAVVARDRGQGRSRWRDEPVDPARPRDVLERERRESPVTGGVNVESYVAASLGPPRWLERLQDIDAEEFRILGELRRAWIELVDGHRRDPEAFAARWRERAERHDLSGLNRLIAQHNEYFPIERRLPFDHRTGDYRAPWGIPWRRASRDAAWILAELPADLALAAVARASTT